MRTRVKALLIAMSLGVTVMAPAKADVFNTTPLDMFPTTLPGAQFSFISNAFVTGDTAIDDLWTFDISGNGSQGASNAAALSTRITATSIDQTPLPLQLKLLAWDGSGYNTLLSESGPSPTLGAFVAASLAANTGGSTGHGFYALEVLGRTPAGASITQYSGQLQVAAVPEPSTYALLVGGLLVVGFQLKRYSA